MADVLSIATDKTADYFSISFLCFKGARETKPGDDEKTCGKYLGLAAAEACFLLGTVIGAIETIFWTAIALLAKVIHLFIPSSYETATSICGNLTGRAVFSANATAVSAAGVAFNFFDTHNAFGNRIHDILNFIDNRLHTYCGFINYQFFGQSNQLDDLDDLS